MLNYYNVKIWQGFDNPYKSKLESEDSPSWSDLVSSDNTGDYVIHLLLSYGDYSNSCMVERSNVESFLDDYPSDDNPHMWEIFGPYGSHAILFEREWIESNDQIQEIFDFLDDYPLYDENYYTDLCWKDYQIAWDDYGVSDFTRDLSEEFDLDDNQRDLLIDSDSLQFLYEYCLSSGEWWYDESPNGVTLLTDYAAKNCDCETMEKFLHFEMMIPSEKRAMKLQYTFDGFESPPSNFREWVRGKRGY